MAIEIVDFPLKMVIFHSYVNLPESNQYNFIKQKSHGMAWIIPGGLRIRNGDLTNQICPETCGFDQPKMG